jgi:hypothetical protein
MSHNYLLDTYRIIDTRLGDARDGRMNSHDDHERCFMDGRLDALHDLRDYLSRRYDIKLPRRIYKQLG